MSCSHALCLLAALALGACTDGSLVPPGDTGAARVEDIGRLPLVDPGEFAPGVTHRWFPMEAGAVWVYEGHRDGAPARETVEVEPGAENLLGVACTVLRQEVFEGGERVEVTTHWFAQDLEGNLWRFGEQTVEFDGAASLLTRDSWRAGEDGALPWIVLGADPKPGDLYLGAHPGGLDEVRVVAIGLIETVPAGTFADCIEAEESEPEDPDDVDQVIYAPGIGPLSETSPTARLELAGPPLGRQ